MTTDGGALYQSTDSGSSWTVKQIRGDQAFYSIDFVGDSIGIISCSRGKIERTTDGGTTWSQSSIASGVLRSVCFTSDTGVIVCGSRGTVLQSKDAGTSWKTIDLSFLPNADNITFLKVLSDRAGKVLLVGDSNCILYSTDAGATWVNENTGFKGTISTADVSWTNPPVLAIGYSSPSATAIQVGHDGPWTVSVFDDTIGFPITALRVSNTSVLAFENSGPYSLFSSDAGHSWEVSSFNPNDKLALNQNTPITGIYLDQEGEGFACGASGTLITVHEFGRRTQLGRHYFPARSGWPQIESVGEHRGTIHVIGNPSGGFATSTDGGQTWISRYDANYGFAPYIGLHFISPQEGVLMGSPYGPNPFPSLRTTDGGDSWSEIVGYPRINATSARFGQDNYLYLTSDSTIYRSMDGVRWDTYSEYTESEPRYSNSAVVGSTIEPAGCYGLPTASGTISYILVETRDSLFDSSAPEDADIPSYSFAASSNSGLTWERRYQFPRKYYVNSMWFLDSQRGYVAGDSCKLFQTRDGGYTWDSVVEVNGDKSVRLASIAFNQAGTSGIVVGDESTVFFTTNSGASWQRDTVEYVGGSSNLHFNGVFNIGDSVFLASSTAGLWKTSLPSQQSRVDRDNTANPYLYIKIWPQPATSFVTCSLYGLYAVEEKQLLVGLYDLLGRKVMDLSTIATAHNEGPVVTFGFSTTALSSGAYRLNIETSNGIVSRGLIITK